MELHVRDDLQCHRCLGPLVLTARVPYSFSRTDGQVVSGLRGISLCASCDRNDPPAQGVLAYLVLNPTVADDDAFAALVAEWACRKADLLVAETVPEEDGPDQP